MIKLRSISNSTSHPYKPWPVVKKEKAGCFHCQPHTDRIIVQHPGSAVKQNSIEGMTERQASNGETNYDDMHIITGR